MTYFKLETYVPEDFVDRVKDALAAVKPFVEKAVG